MGNFKCDLQNIRINIDVGWKDEIRQKTKVAIVVSLD